MEVKTIEPKKLNEGLGSNLGSLQNYKHFLNGIYTSGVRELAEKYGAYWLIDAVFSYQGQKSTRNIPFQLWILTVTDSKAVLEMSEDTPDEETPVLIRQKIPYTDCPEGIITLYLIDNVLLLPVEY